MGNTSNRIKEAKTLIEKLNGIFRSMNLPELGLVHPKDCLPQEKNAHYFEPEKFQRLVDNIKADGKLSSIPLVYPEGEKFRIISGHHRIDAAKQAKIDWILVFIDRPKSKDEIISKQLSHNALVGKDDKAILAELFNEIKDIEQKLATGLDSEIEKISYTSLNFKLGTFKQFVLLFPPNDLERFEEVMAELKETFYPPSKAEVTIVDLAIFDKFAESLRAIKKTQNIKSNAVAFNKMVEIASEWIQRHKDTEKQQAKLQESA